MEYIRSKKYFTPDLQTKIMGPNPIKLQEELLQNHKIPSGSYVCDLGSGQGLTSVFLAKEYGFVVFAVQRAGDGLAGTELVCVGIFCGGDFLFCAV